ncbi:MAG: ABC transporter ATP-binding protein/permease [Oscillospiraceae bacterium]|nr:ABC transporter ATP-binding protein/permease [Oscillospiraceae bacterium]
MQGYRRKCIIGLVLACVAQIMLIFNPFIMRIVIDTFISAENAAENLATQRNLLFILIGLTLIINLGRTGLQYTVQMLFESCSQGTVYRIRKHLFENMQKQDQDFYDLHRTGDIMTRLSGDIDMLRHTTAWSLRTMFENIVCFTAVSVFYFTINPFMALCMLVLTPLIFVFSIVFQKKVGPLFGKLRDSLSELNTAAEENISGNRVVKAFAAEDYEKERFSKANKKYAEQSKETSIVWWKFFLPMETTSQAIFAVHLLSGGLFAIYDPNFTMGDYMAFSMLAWALSMPLSTLGHVINDLKRFSASATKIIEVYYSRPKIVDRSDAVKLTQPIKGEIEFQNVSFAYPSGGEKGKAGIPVLKDISFKIDAGETVAIMGETGSGKSTLINLIPRLYDVTKGKILIDGHNIRMLKLKDLRSSIGTATQEVLLYSDSIEGNIAFGIDDSNLSEEQLGETVREYAKMAAAHNFILNTSDEYNTIVGERGVGLSGGQKQRIALARALAVNPGILILDDTTSAVDSETESHIQESLRKLDNCTKIIICARISSAKDADKIIVLQNGEIAEMGSHDELVQNGGYYSEVYELQK